MKELNISISNKELTNILNILTDLQKINTEDKDIIKVLWYNKGVFLYSINGEKTNKKVNSMKTFFKKKEDFISNFPKDLEMTWIINNTKEWVKQHKFLLNDGSENIDFKFRYDEETMDINSIEAKNTFFQLRSVSANDQSIMNLTPEMAREKLNPVLAEWKVDLNVNILDDIKKMSKFETSDTISLAIDDDTIKIKGVKWDFTLGKNENIKSTPKFFLKSHLDNIKPHSDTITILVYDSFILVDEKGSYLMFTHKLND